MSASEPALSAVVLCGSRRERLPRLREAIAAQTASDDVELVLVGGDGREEPERAPGSQRLTRVPWPSGRTIGDARADGARQATGEIVAFLLDSNYPEPGWADALIDAYRREGWAALGYGFRNANPGSRGSDTTFLANWGPWLNVPPGEVAILPGFIVSYRRAYLLALGPELGSLLDVDSIIHRRMLESGQKIGVEPRVVVAAECFQSTLDAARSNATYARLLAGRRMRTEGWPIHRRVLGAVAAPLVATSLKLARTWRGSGARPGAFLRCLPGLAAISLGWALGESRGYLWGEGRTPERMVYWEVEANRAGG